MQREGRVFMRVALAIDRFDARKGGAERSLARILTALAERGHDVTLGAMRLQGLEGTGWGLCELRVPPLPGGWRQWWFASTVDSRLRAAGAEVILGVRHLLRGEVFLARGGLHCETVHGNLRAISSPLNRVLYGIRPQHRILLAMERRWLRRPPGPLVIAPSDLVRRHCEAYGLRMERVVTVRTGVDLEAFRPAEVGPRVDLRRRFGIGSEVVGLFVAHNFRLKGLECLLKAWDRLPKERYRLLVAGRGRRAAGWSRLPNVTFLGERSEVKDLYQAADVLVHPTYYDPFSRVVIEALACGLPVVTTRFNGAAEIVREERDGFVLDHPGQVDLMVDRLIRLGDERMRRSFSESARRQAERHPEGPFLEATVGWIEHEAQRSFAARRSKGAVR